MSGTISGGTRTAQTLKAKDKNYYVKLGKLGGAAGRGHQFAHGKISPREAGKLGGRPAGFKVPPAQRKLQSLGMKAAWQKRKQAEQLFVPDNAEFGEGFNEPSWKSKLMKRIMK